AGDENAGKRLTVLRAIDKLDKFGPEGVKLLLGAGRKDESGDFTKGAGLDETGVETGMKYVAAQSSVGNEATVASIRQHIEMGPTGVEGLSELDEIAVITMASGYADRVKIDPSVVRGLEYYTGPVFEAELLFETVNEKGEPARFGSVGGGGRYDGLVGRFRSEPVPATGFSIGVSRLMAALTALGKISEEPETGPVVVTIFDRDRI